MLDEHGSPQVVLDILVENAGRVNYGVPLESRKGTMVCLSTNCEPGNKLFLYVYQSTYHSPLIHL